jgi:cellobiose phosphorylase
MAGSKNLAEDPYERLANAIVLQAVADYRVALKKIKAYPKNREAISEALEIEKFFRSGWYSILTDVDGEYLIRRLQDEIRQSESIRGKKNKSIRR